MDNYICKIATKEELLKRWDYLLTIHPGNNSWCVYKQNAIRNFEEGNTISYLGFLNNEIICELTAYIKNEAFIGDISDEEFTAVLKPFLDNYDEYIESYIMPEVIAYYIANSYYRNAMYEGSFLQHYNSAKDLINMFCENEEKVKAEVFKLLLVKYALSITNENPLEIKKIEY